MTKHACRTQKWTINASLASGMYCSGKGINQQLAEYIYLISAYLALTNINGDVRWRPMRVRRQPDDWRDRPLRLAADVSPAWAPSALTAASMPSGFKTRNT